MKNKRQDPMPPPDATPEEIGEFWDTHDLADYWDETQEVEFQVDLRSKQNQVQSNEPRSDLSATSEDTSNTAIGVVTDLVSDSTIPAPIRRNMFKAFDRLCSALIDIPVGALERISAEKRSESKARIKITEAVNAQIIEQIKVDPEYARIAVSKYGKKILREQVNLDKISAIAANELTEDGPDSSVNQSTSEPNEMQSVDSTNQEANSGEEKTIDDDWLNSFEAEARQKSTEEMQLRFGRILAGEIKNPGSFSIRALKTFGELDQSVAILFQRLCSVCVVMEFPLTKHVAEMKDRILGRDHGSTSNTISKILYCISSIYEM